MSVITEFVQYTVTVKNSGSVLKQRPHFRSDLLNIGRVPNPCWS